MADFGDLPRPSVDELKIKNPSIEKPSSSKIPELEIDRMVLYHGSGIGGIREFRQADEATIGNGLYLTSDIAAGRGYAIRRAKRDPNYKAVVYEVEVNNLKLADLRTIEGVTAFAQLLKIKIETLLKDPNLSWLAEGIMKKTLETINQKSYRSLTDLTGNNQRLTTEILKEQGYNGLVGLEGGEGDEIGDHDSYVIFDPVKVKVLREI